ncbi:MAG: DUF3857 and transglutaminase domain-containing protein [Cyclobacteriaceae bacterium]|nr:DUF3857 and transglutaminase domain-containing protein [Cyclobacteriaceae bacterium]
MSYIKIICSAIAYLLIHTSAAQFNSNQAPVTLEELITESFSSDSSANAVILFDFGETIVDYSGTKIKYHRRIKILKRDALDKWGNITVFAPRSNVSKIEGSIFNVEDGKIDQYKIEEDFLFKESYNKNIDKISFAFPKLKEGSIIEYKYSIKTGETFIPSWEFQHSIPTLRSEYSVFYPVSNGFTSTLQGTIPFTHVEKKLGDRQFRWVIENLPAFQEEPLMPFRDSYPAAIKFWTIYESWKSIRTHLMNREDFGEVLTKHYFLKKDVEEIIHGIAEPLEKIRAIAAFIKKNIQWNNVSDYYAILPSKLLKDKSGSSGDINLFYGSLLRKAGFDVSMVLLSTRDHGFILEDLPSLRQFNYVVCHVKINGKDLYLDATNKYLSFDVLPEQCTNTKGLKVGKDSHELVMIPKYFGNKKVLQADMIIDNTTLVGNISQSHSGHEAAAGRNLFQRDNHAFFTKYLGELFTSENSEVQNIENIDEPLKIQSSVSISNQIISNNDRMYIDPILFYKLESNPFRTSYRKYPIDFGLPEERTLILTLSLPLGFVVEEIPPSKALSMSNKGMRYYVNVSQIDKRIIVTSSFQISQVYYNPEEYANIREFYSSVIALQSKQIVLRKNE